MVGASASQCGGGSGSGVRTEVGRGCPLCPLCPLPPASFCPIKGGAPLVHVHLRAPGREVPPRGPVWGKERGTLPSPIWSETMGKVGDKGDKGDTPDQAKV